MSTKRLVLAGVTAGALAVTATTAMASTASAQPRTRSRPRSPSGSSPTRFSPRSTSPYPRCRSTSPTASPASVRPASRTALIWSPIANVSPPARWPASTSARRRGLMPLALHVADRLRAALTSPRSAPRGSPTSSRNLREFEAQNNPDRKGDLRPAERAPENVLPRPACGCWRRSPACRPPTRGQWTPTPTRSSALGAGERAVADAAANDILKVERLGRRLRHLALMPQAANRDHCRPCSTASVRRRTSTASSACYVCVRAGAHRRRGAATRQPAVGHHPSGRSRGPERTARAAASTR